MSAHGGDSDSTLVDESTKREWRNRVRGNQQPRRAVNVASSSANENRPQDALDDFDLSFVSDLIDDVDRLTTMADEIKDECARILPRVHDFEVATTKMAVIKVECQQLERNLTQLNAPFDERGVPHGLLKNVTEKFFTDLQNSTREVLHDYATPLHKILMGTNWILLAVQGDGSFDLDMVRNVMSEGEFEEVQTLTTILEAFQKEMDVWNTTGELFRDAKMALGWELS